MTLGSTPRGPFAATLTIGLVACAALAEPSAPLIGQQASAEGVGGTAEATTPGARPASLSERTRDDSERESSEASRIERRLALRVARRDALLARLESDPPVGLGDKLIDAWQRRRTRAELEELVADLQRDQTRLLALRARTRSLDDVAAERDWDRLQALVDDAARAWRDGQAGEPLLEPAIAEALDRVGGRNPARTFERYRSLVDRLARVNAVLADTLHVPPDSSSESDAVANRDGSRMATETSDFLGVAERGLPVNRPPADASQEAWKRLRTTLANEIVSTATEITLRVRESS